MASWIVYDFPPDAESRAGDLYVLAADGSRETRIVDHPSNDVVLGWAPGGGILFLSDRSGTPGAWLLPMTGGDPAGAPVLVKPDLFGAVPGTFLDDGSFMYVVATGSRDAYTASLSQETGQVGGDPVRINGRGSGNVRHPAWSPDGRHLAYFVQPAPSIVASRALAVRSLETGEMRRLPLEELRYPWDLLWLPSPIGLLVVASDEDGMREVSRIDLRTGEVELVLAKNPSVYMSDFVATPDGEALVFKEENLTGEAAFEARVVVHDLATGDERVIFRTIQTPKSELRELAISPDGRSLAWVRWNGEGNPADLMVMPLAGDEPRRVASDHVSRQIGWSPDGRHLLYSRRADADDTDGIEVELLRVAAGGGEAEPIGLRMDALRDLAVHPSSGRISFIAGDTENELWVMEDFLPAERTAARATGNETGRRR